jgi:hypothetical protein
MSSWVTRKFPSGSRAPELSCLHIPNLNYTLM